MTPEEAGNLETTVEALEVINKLVVPKIENSVSLTLRFDFTLREFMEYTDAPFEAKITSDDLLDFVSDNGIVPELLKVEISE